MLTVGGALRPYDVRAVIAKSGGAAGGHYVCAARAEYARGHRWWLADDEAVTAAEDWGAPAAGGGGGVEGIAGRASRLLSDLPLFRTHAAVLFACEARA